MFGNAERVLVDAVERMSSLPANTATLEPQNGWDNWDQWCDGDEGTGLDLPWPN